MTADNRVPPGFVESKGRGPFTTHNGPIYHKFEGESIIKFDQEQK